MIKIAGKKIHVDISNQYLGHKQLKSVPERIYDLSQLQVLDLSNNQLTSVHKCTERIGDLSQLQRLRLSHNQLRFSIGDYVSRKKLLAMLTYYKRAKAAQTLAITLMALKKYKRTRVFAGFDRLVVKMLLAHDLKGPLRGRTPPLKGTK